MHRIRADHQWTLQLAGVPAPVYRPVNIDQSQTGLLFLRSLRIYHFNAGSVIDGHAEDDEVLIVILAGMVHLTISQHELEEDSPQFSLSAVGDSHGALCVAYLPPNGAYRLVPQTNAEVAYARARTLEGREPRVFSHQSPHEDAGERTLLMDNVYPVHLRLRIAQVKASHQAVTVMPIEHSESEYEALVHVRTEPEHGAATISIAKLRTIALESWDSVSVLPGERPALRVAANSSALLLAVLASRKPQAS